MNSLLSEIFLGKKYKIFILFSLILIIIKNYLYPVWWIQIGQGEIDKWFYFGSAQNLDYFREHFNQTYYLRRWVSIFPIFLLQLFLDANLSLFILFHLSIFFSIILTLKIINLILNENLSGYLICIFLFIFSEYVSLQIASMHSTYIAIPLYLFILKNVVEDFQSKIFNLRKIFLTFFLLGIIIISFQGYIYTALFVYTSYIIYLIRLSKLKKEFIKFNLEIVKAVIIIVILDSIIGIVLNYHSNIILYSLRASFGILTDEVWGQRDYFKILLPKETYLFIVMLIFSNLLSIKNNITNLENNEKYLIMTISFLLIYYLPQMISYNKFLFGTHPFILAFITIIVFSSTLIIDLTLKQKLYLNLICLSISLLGHYLFFKLSNESIFYNFILGHYLSFKLSNEAIFYNFIGILALLIFLNYLLKNNLRIRKILSSIGYFSIFCILVIFSFEFHITQKKAKNYNINKIEKINHLSREIKEITQYDDKYRIWILDVKKDFKITTNNILMDTMYSDYTRFYKPYDVCGQIAWFKLFENSIIYARGFSNSNEAEEKIFKIIKTCDLERKNIEELDLKFNNAYSFKLNYDN
tara:strand:+ start:4794 stop:6542 length:1749 start_codon:yes stop_codon:yes gene_type:complete